MPEETLPDKMISIRVGTTAQEVTTQLEKPVTKLTKDHPLVGEPCSACRELLKVFDPIVMIPLGPGSDKEQRKKARSGMAYNAISLVVHRACGTGAE